MQGMLIVRYQDPRGGNAHVQVLVFPNKTEAKQAAEKLRASTFAQMHEGYFYVEVL